MNRKIINARIESVELGYEDHGILTAWLHLEFGSSGQGFGGYALDSNRPYKYDNLTHARRITDGLEIKSHRMPNLSCGYFIMRVLEVVGVDSWEKLPGKHVRVDSDWNKIYRIGNILQDNWFDVEEMKYIYSIERDTQNEV
jgi:hypothetical protein